MRLVGSFAINTLISYLKVNHKTKQYYGQVKKTIKYIHHMRPHILLTNNFVAKPSVIQRGSDKTLIELLRDGMLQTEEKENSCADLVFVDLRCFIYACDSAISHDS